MWLNVKKAMCGDGGHFGKQYQFGRIRSHDANREVKNIVKLRGWSFKVKNATNFCVVMLCNNLSYMSL